VIKVLPEQVANQIAAGEVIERPVSVVKELVENSIDSGATQITVEIDKGGRNLIRVTDDGCGMSSDDALLCLERHATSKIAVADDLYHIRSMGFRGEALPSIASVSKFTIVTKQNKSDKIEGTEVFVSGGRLIDVKPAGRSPGTTVEVRNLFFNLPARRKFMRSVETERSHIQHYLYLVAMAYPYIAITLIQEGKVVLKFPKLYPDAAKSSAQILKERFEMLYGADMRLVQVDASINYDSTPEEDAAQGAPAQMIPLRLWGVMGAPGEARSTKDRQNFFVNLRPVDNKGLSYALTDTYQNSLMRGKYPICCLFLEMDPSEIDVNVHPSKREIKFHKEERVRRIVAKILKDALERYSGKRQSTQIVSYQRENNSAVQCDPFAIPASSSSQPVYQKEILPASSEVEKHDSRESQSALLSNKAKKSTETERQIPIDLPKKQLPKILSVADIVNKHTTKVGANSYHLEKQNVIPQVASNLFPENELKTSEEKYPKMTFPGEKIDPQPLLTLSLRFIGVLNKLYILLESNRGLVLLDQHAAHERIQFERLMNQLKNGTVESQQLLLSETVKLDAKDTALLKKHLKICQQLGIGVSDFSDNTFLIDAMPPFVKGIHPRQFIQELVDHIRITPRELTRGDLMLERIASHACKLAVKANDYLDLNQIEQLVEDLKKCAMPYTCPHGRPTLIEISVVEIEKKFGRK